MLTLKHHTNYNAIFSRYYKNSKRYVLIFNRWTYKIKAKSITEYDTIEDAQEEINLINELYKDTPKPIEKWYVKNNKEEYFDNRDVSYWGYVLIDFKEEKITIGNNGIYFPYRFNKDCLKRDNRLFIKDYFFRKEDEIPENYKWDGIEEYSGWLRFRWGDGKNSIEYVDNLKNNKKKTVKNENKECQNYDNTKDEIDEIVDKFDNELVRHMIETKNYKW